ncbi:MAG TPA: glycosyltransferase [Gemmatimonadaceae bacterium]|nr:glycosyltransferase [Gemmatimonadaceae bacterium]
MTVTRQDADKLDIQFSVVSGSRENLLFDCIASVLDTMKDSRYSWRLTAISNDARPGLVRRLRERFPTIDVIENSEPKGFAANHNVVLRTSGARYTWILNDDLVIMPGTIDQIVAYMDQPRNEKVAVVSPRLMNPDGSLQPSTYSFPTIPQTLLGFSGIRDLRITNKLLTVIAPILRRGAGSSRFWAHDQTIEVDTFRGACVAVRMSAVKEVGVMTEAALVGAEEIEWHRRLKDRGWKIIFFADASVIHYGSQTVAEGSQDLYSEYLKGLLHYFKSHRSPARFRAFVAALVGLYTARLSIARVQRNEKKIEVARQYLQVVRNAM